MKRFVLVSSLISMVALLLFSGAAYLWAGNGITVTGAHYNLNLIGVTGGKTISLTGSDRHTIFVPLVTAKDGELDTLASDSAPIALVQGADFEVCQGSALAPPVLCPGSTFSGTLPKLGAVFQLPCNNLDSLGLIVPCTSSGSGSIAPYEVWARYVGKAPVSGTSTITLCAFDTTTSATVCNTDAIIAVRFRNNKFTDVTAALTSLIGVLGPSGVGNYPLFAAGFTGFFWDYDNAGNKVLQLRFYPI